LTDGCHISAEIARGRGGRGVKNRESSLVEKRARDVDSKLLASKSYADDKGKEGRRIDFRPAKRGKIYPGSRSKKRLCSEKNFTELWGEKLTPQRNFIPVQREGKRVFEERLGSRPHRDLMRKEE